MSDFYVGKVAVLGAGVMGAQIAAHCINAGIQAVLFDLSADLVGKSLKALTKLQPSPFATAEYVNLIQSANYDQHLHLLKECDLVIEAISERIDWKVDLYKKITPHLGENTVLASNTSGLSIHQLAEVIPEKQRERFLGIHFFNPPRYMSLVELIPHETTDKKLMDEIETFLVSTLGKGVVRAKDTPNFIANRVGIFSLLSTIYYAEQFRLGLDVVDALTGHLIGRAKSATFRTLDIVGLDTFSHVVQTMLHGLMDDPWHPLFKTPGWIQNLIEKGAIGQKAKVGIFKKEKQDIFVYDIKDQHYRLAAGKPSAAIIDILKIKDPVARFAALYESDKPEAQFLWNIFRELFHYCAYHLNTIADCVRDVDLAIRWGFGWKQGIFETWQQADWSSIVERIEKDIAAGKSLSKASLPEWVKRNAVYDKAGAYSPKLDAFLPRTDLPVYQKQMFPDPVLAEVYPRGETVFENDAVRLWHMQDDIAILSFNTKMNAISSDVLDGILQAIHIAENAFKGLVIWQPGEHFSAGADLKQFASVCATGNFDALSDVIEKFQSTCLALRYSRVPTIAATRGYVLGGGCEVMMHCTRTVAALESYIGLVEVGVGVLPAGGGTKEMALRALQQAKGQPVFPTLRRYYENIAKAEVAKSALDARDKGYLRDTDIIILNPYELLYVAKAEINALKAANYHPPLRPEIAVAGKDVLANLRWALINFREGGFISSHDYLIADTIADIICGGELEAGTPVNEDWYLKRERLGFVQLMKTPKTQARIQHMLETGKPLRN